MRSLNLMIILMIAVSVSAQNNTLFWDFEGENPYIDRISKTIINYNGFINTNIIKADNNNVLHSFENSDLIRFPLSIGKSNRLKIKFEFKGNEFKITSLPQMNLKIQFVYDYIEIMFNVLEKGKKKLVRNKIPLRGTRLLNYNYWVNEKVKYFEIDINGLKGNLSIQLDSLLQKEFSINIDKFDSFDDDNEMTLRLDGMIDNLQFQLSKELSSKYKGTNINAKRINSENTYDLIDFAPGFPKYNVSAIEQLRNFPSPRYILGFNYKRNFSWFDITYLYKRYDYYSNKKSSIPISNPHEVLDMMKELYEKWNYYFEIPTLRMEREKANAIYKDKNSVYGILLDYARRHPELKTSTILIQLQNNSLHAGFEIKGNYENSQNLPDSFYLRNSEGKFITKNKKKILSPINDLDFKKKDAFTSVYYLKTLYDNLKRPIDFINENGEIFGHAKDFDLYKNDPRLSFLIKSRNFKNKFEISGYIQNLFDTTYKNTIIGTLKWDSTTFTFYNVSAYNSSYWPSYDYRRTSNNIEDKIHYSTPSFYPSKPYVWDKQLGELNGYNSIAEGRKREIEKGDLLFSPFVSAGWSLDYENILPSQWLSLLKSMLMLGAEYFYTGYFNVTTNKGWPNGIGANDPSGYIYQVAMPSYVQALFPYVKEYLIKGKLMSTDENTFLYRLKGTKYNHLIIARKLNKKYLLLATIQPNSNYKGIINDVETSVVDLEGTKYIINVSKQGSLYEIDISNQDDIKVVQLDSWHESSHPYYWKKEAKIEAEILVRDQERIFSEGIKKNSEGVDTRNCLSYIDFNSKVNRPSYISSFSKLYISMRGKGKINILGKSIDVKDSNWKIFEISNNGSLELMKYISGKIEIDYLVFK